MYCTNCGQFNPDSASRCSACGAALEPLPSPGAPSAGTPAANASPYPQYVPQQAPVPVQQPAFDVNSIPPEYRPISPWAYWGLGLLYAVPIVGFVFLIVYSFSRGNINRRNFTRSYFCWWVILLTICLIVLILLSTGILTASSFSWLSRYSY